MGGSVLLGGGGGGGAVSWMGLQFVFVAPPSADAGQRRSFQPTNPGKQMFRRIEFVGVVSCATTTGVRERWCTRQHLVPVGKPPVSASVVQRVVQREGAVCLAPRGERFDRAAFQSSGGGGVGGGPRQVVKEFVAVVVMFAVVAGGELKSSDGREGRGKKTFAVVLQREVLRRSQLLVQLGTDFTFGLFPPGVAVAVVVGVVGVVGIVGIVGFVGFVGFVGVVGGGGSFSSKAGVFHFLHVG